MPAACPRHTSSLTWHPAIIRTHPTLPTGLLVVVLAVIPVVVLALVVVVVLLVLLVLGTTSSLTHRLL